MLVSRIVVARRVTGQLPCLAVRTPVSGIPSGRSGSRSTGRLISSIMSYNGCRTIARSAESTTSQGEWKMFVAQFWCLLVGWLVVGVAKSTTAAAAAASTSTSTSMRLL